MEGGLVEGPNSNGIYKIIFPNRELVKSFKVVFENRDIITEILELDFPISYFI